MEAAKSAVYTGRGEMHNASDPSTGRRVTRNREASERIRGRVDLEIDTKAPEPG
jgi:hypothetical protein